MASRKRSRSNFSYVIPYTFSVTLTKDVSEAALPFEFGDTFYGNYPYNVLLRHQPSGAKFQALFSHDDWGACKFGSGFEDLSADLGLEEGDMLDLTYYGQGRFTFEVVKHDMEDLVDVEASLKEMVPKVYEPDHLGIEVPSTVEMDPVTKAQEEEPAVEKELEAGDKLGEQMQEAPPT